MKRLYLIRHAKPDFPPGERVCLGLTDLPLGKLGRLQCVLLRDEFRNTQVSGVYSSYLSRALQTAQYLCPEPEIEIGLEEMSAGEWDGMLFSDIVALYPELYKERGENPDTPIPGAEDIYMGQERFYNCLMNIMEGAEGDVIAVAHSTVIQSFLCCVLDEPPTECRKYKMPYCGHSVFEYDGEFHLIEMNVPPKRQLSRELCFELLKEAQLPEKVIRHSAAVCDEALEIGKALNEKGLGLDLELIEFAALLHDIARTEENHPARGAQLLSQLGFEEISDIVSQHHQLRSDNIDEAAVVYIADKFIKEDKKLSLCERFAASEAKCTTAEAAAAHERRKEQAQLISQKIEDIILKALPL